MDHGHFDALTRSVAGGAGSRRSALRFLAGGLLTGLAARVGLTEVGKAKQPRRQRTKHEGQGTVPAADNRKGKKPHKNKHKGKDKPNPCGRDEHRCGPGPCIPIHQCCSNQKRCANGSCGAKGECCASEKRCLDGSCVAESACCAGERRCGNGTCIPFHLCCPDEKSCDDGECVARDDCCPDELPPACDEGENVVCCQGELRCRAHWDERTCNPYGAWLEYDPATCQCECPANAVPVAGTPYCCPADHPISGGGVLCVDDAPEQVCVLGFAPCEDYPADCCPIDWPPARSGRPDEASGSRRAEATTPRRRSHRRA